MSRVGTGNGGKTTEGVGGHPKVERLLSGAGFWPVLIPAALVGAWLRLDQILDQIPADDEWHALHTVVYSGFAGIGGSFGVADRSIPITLYLELCSRVFSVSEWVLRLPSLLPGLLSLILLPFLWGRMGGSRTVGVFGWLLAVSPVCVYYSRYARPYAAVLLLTSFALLSFHRWWESGARGLPKGYLAAAVTAPWFHLAVFPFVLAPILFGALDAFITSDRRVQWRSLARAAALACAGQALLLLPPALADPAALHGKAGRGEVQLETVLGALALLAGTPRSAMVWAFFAAVAAGALLTLSKDRRVFLYLCLPAVLQVAFVFLLQPASVRDPIVFARYSLPILPILLWWASAAWARLFEGPDPGGRGLRLWIPPVIPAVLLFAAGPLPELLARPNAWTNHGWYQYSYSEDQRALTYRSFQPDAQPLPPFYRELSLERPGSLLLLEAPWRYEWHLNRFHLLQRIHRQRIGIGFAGTPEEGIPPGEYPLGSEGIDFRSFAHLSDLERIRRLGTRYVILHRRPAEEFRAVPKTVRWPEMGRWVDFYRDEIGSPVYEDEWISVFDMKEAPRERN